MLHHTPPPFGRTRRTTAVYGDSHSRRAHAIMEATDNLTLVQYDEGVSFLYLVLVLIKFLILPALATAFSFHSK